ANSSRKSRAFRPRRNWVILFCMAEISCAVDGSGSLSRCRCQSFFNSSSFIWRLLHQTGKFLLGAMQHDANVIGGDAGGFCNLFVSEVLQEKGDECFFEWVQFVD